MMRRRRLRNTARKLRPSKLERSAGGNGAESPANGRALAGPAGGDLAQLHELEALVDQHWQLLSITDKVRALLNTYAGAV
jgi:hypothetical protein